MTERAGADPRDDLYQVAALLAELDRVLNPLAPHERGDVMSTPAMPPPLPPVTPRGAPPRSSGPASPSRRSFSAAAPSTPSSPRTAAPAKALPSASGLAPPAPRRAPPPPARAHRAAPAQPRPAFVEPAPSPSRRDGSPARPPRTASTVPIEGTGGVGRAGQGHGTTVEPAGPRRSSSTAAASPPEQSIAPAAARETAGAPRPAPAAAIELLAPPIPRAVTPAPRIEPAPPTPRVARDESPAPRAARSSRPAPPALSRAVVRRSSDRDASSFALARRVDPARTHPPDGTARSAPISPADHRTRSRARSTSRHAPSAPDRLVPPRLPRAPVPDPAGPRRLGDPTVPPPLPRSRPAFDVEDRTLAPEPPPPAVDPFDDDEDDDDAVDGDGVGPGAGSVSPPVTFYLRGGRMRVPVAAAAIARADRRLSRLARKRGRRL